jgi:hypothetical protein
VAIHEAPCCHKPVDVPENVEDIKGTLVICPHCGAALSYHEAALHLHEARIEGSLASLLNMLQDMQAHPERYLEEDSGAPDYGRAVCPAQGVH